MALRAFLNCRAVFCFIPDWLLARVQLETAAEFPQFPRDGDAGLMSPITPVGILDVGVKRKSDWYTLNVIGRWFIQLIFLNRPPLPKCFLLACSQMDICEIKTDSGNHFECQVMRYR